MEIKNRLSGKVILKNDLADLRGADLRGADLRDADLCGANLRDADLCGANLCGADLCDANLRDVQINENTSMLEIQCPSEGSFIAWKKASGFIVKLMVTEDAKRSSATALKCRCSKALVLAIEKVDGTRSDEPLVYSDYLNTFKYLIGSIVEVDNFDENRWNECSSGIHFFISRNVAVQYS